MLIYVVEGSTGEYSDHREWLVRAYRDEDKAKEHVLKATSRANELYAKAGGSYWDIDENNEYDPGMHVDYTGVRYAYYKVELEE